MCDHPPSLSRGNRRSGHCKNQFLENRIRSMRLAGVAYILPFMFVSSPTLLLRGSLGHVLFAALTAIAGTVLLGIALVGYFVRNLGWIQRVVIGLCGVALILPPNPGGLLYVGWVANFAGLVVAAFIVFYEWQRRPSRIVRSSKRLAS